VSELYRVTLRYKLTRPRYSLYYIHHILSRPNDGYFEDDLEDVGVAMEVILGNYDTITGAKSAKSHWITRNLKPKFWKEDELAKWPGSGDGYEILGEEWEQGQQEIVWNKLDTP
jgi:hypothetical protein